MFPFGWQAGPVGCNTKGKAHGADQSAHHAAALVNKAALTCRVVLISDNGQKDAGKRRVLLAMAAICAGYLTRAAKLSEIAQWNFWS
jgi:hypothetical protein